jgi:hypothetical protein
MKYLKLFEELNYENSKLTEDEFYDEVGDALAGPHGETPTALPLGAATKSKSR